MAPYRLVSAMMKLRSGEDNLPPDLRDHRSVETKSDSAKKKVRERCTLPMGVWLSHVSYGWSETASTENMALAQTFNAGSLSRIVFVSFVAIYPGL